VADLIQHWALTAYPISDLQRSALEQTVGRDVEVASLSVLRDAGVFRLVRRLLAVRAAHGYVITADSDSAPLVPVLRVLAALTRCRALAVFQSDGRIDPFGRPTALVDLIRLFVGSLGGAAAALRCRFELRRLGAREPSRPRLGPIRHVVYLKTNLWFGVKAGGSVGHVAGVANALGTRVPRVDLFSVEKPPLLSPAINCHVVAHRRAFGFPFELNYYAYQRLFVREVRRACAGARPDLIYQRLSLANYSGLTLARELGVPLIVEYNGSEVWVSKHWGDPLHFPDLAARGEDVMLRHADLIVTVSEVLADELKARGVPSERIVVHPNCVDPERFDPARYSSCDREQLLSRYGIDPSSAVCGFIGTFGLWHGVVMLAESIRQMAEMQGEWLARNGVHFLLVGDGVLMPQVRAILDSPQTRRFVTMTGLVEQHEAPRYLAACDILLSPHVPNADGSRFFGSPTKLFEYMAMGKAIVASDLDQIGQVLAQSLRGPNLAAGGASPDGALAVLIEPGHRGQLIDGIRYLVERPAVRERLGVNARREVLARYTWDRNVAELLDRIETLGLPH
jgi:glycosyltransferase involved in cell wall biosynthesis